MSDGTLVAADNLRVWCPSEPGVDSTGVVKLDIEEEHCENGDSEAEKSDGGGKALSADAILSLLGRRFCREDAFIDIPSSAKLFFRGTRTLSCLERRFFVNPVRLSAELERPKDPEVRRILGAWKSSSRVVAYDRAARIGSEMMSCRPWSTCDRAIGEERRMTMVSESELGLKIALTDVEEERRL